MTEPGEDLVDKTVRECVDGKAGVFGGFYRPYLEDCARRVYGWRRRWGREAAAIDLPGVAASLLQVVMEACHQVGVRTLIALFRAKDAEHRDHAAFHEWVCGPGRAEVLGRFPELDRLLRLVADVHCRHAEHVARTAWRERDLLDRNFGARGAVVALTPGLGDTHRGGRSVCSVRWENGVTVLYKPHRRGFADLVVAARALVDGDGSFFGPLLPRTVGRPEHLWQERVAQADIDDEAGQARYFRRFGRVAALLTMFGANDLHHENVIATPAGPVVIDTETLVSLPGTATRGALATDVEASVLNTLLFPIRYKGHAMDVDLSAIGSVDRGRSPTLRTFTVVGAGTGDIRFDEVPVTIAPGPSMVTERGEPVDPRGWTDEIMAGFAEARELLRRRRADIERAVADSGGWAIRHVLRPTYVYSRFLEASTHPAYLASRQDRTALLNRLPHAHRGVNPGFGAALTRAEVEALLDLDIPYFDVECDSGDLRANGGEEVLPGAVRGTPRQAVRAAIDRFFSRPPGRDLAYIRFSLAGSVDDVWESRGPRGRPVTVCRDMLADPAAWHASLRDLVVGAPDRPTFLAAQLDDRGLRMSAVNAVLYEGGGLLYYLARAGADIGADVGRVYDGVIRELGLFRRPLRIGSALWVSPFTGAFSNAVTGLELHRLGVALEMPPPAPAVTAGPHLDPGGMTREDLDYLNGYGGHLVYLAEYGEAGPRIPGFDVARVLARLVEVDGPPEEPAGELGLAHGRFGRLAAMSAAVAADPDGHPRVREHLERVAAGYLRHRWADEAMRDPAGGSGWCKGYAGVAYAAAKLLRAIGFATADVRQAIAPEVERVVTGELGGDVSLCHGVAGRMAVLCWLADRLGWPELRDHARALEDAFLDRYGEGGWSCGIGTAPDLPSFLLGLSGWHFARLMVADPAVEPPLCLGGR